jgi:hypothetical protein
MPDYRAMGFVVIYNYDVRQLHQPAVVLQRQLGRRCKSSRAGLDDVLYL